MSDNPLSVATDAHVRSVIVVCGNCPHTVEWTARGQFPMTDEQATRRLDRELTAEGWLITADGEICPKCVKAAR